MKKEPLLAFWLASAVLLLLTVAFAAPVSAQPFVHPGGILTQSDMDRMKAKVAAHAHPWIDDWNRLITDPLAQDTYQPKPLANMGKSRQQASLDAHAAYLNTIRWYISGDTRYADTAIRICNAWSETVNQVPTGQDIPGLNAIPTAEFALVGELLRVCPRWKPEDFARFQTMLLTYWYPPVHEFLATQNGPGNTRFWANWNISNIGACLAIGVLCDNRAIFNEGVSYFKSPLGTGSIWNAVYFVHPGGLGQWQETGRDQEHAQLGVGLMAQLCQVAWNQGLDLYGYADNRLLAGAEYVAQWNLWKPVPYKYYTNSDHANQNWPSANGRGRLDDRPLWELLYNHYVVLKGLRAPNVQAMAQLMRPEGGSKDHFGYGTLTFTLDAKKSPYPPSPPPPAPTKLSATAGIGRVFLTWARSGDTAQGYEVRRAAAPGGADRTIASWTDSTRCEWTDMDVTPGVTYSYVVAAQNQAGKSGLSSIAQATPAAAGALPPGWLLARIGPVMGAQAGYADVSKGTFLVSGSGTGIGGAADGLTYVYRSLTGDGAITVRLADVDWHGGGAQKVGIMIRASLAPDAPALVMKLGDIGTRQAGFGARAGAGGQMTWTGGNDYTSLPAWFRLARVGDTVTGYESPDGARWFPVGTSTVPFGRTCLLGLALSSHSDSVDTAYFDHVSVTGG